MEGPVRLYTNQTYSGSTAAEQLSSSKKIKLSVTRSGLITMMSKLNAIVNCRVPVADVHFRVPHGVMSPHRYFVGPES